MFNFKIIIKAFKKQNGELTSFHFSTPFFIKNIDVIEKMMSKGIILPSDYSSLLGMTSRQRSEGGMLKFRQMPEFMTTMEEMARERGVEIYPQVTVTFRGSLSKNTKSRARAVSCLNIYSKNGQRIPYTKEFLNFEMSVNE